MTKFNPLSNDLIDAALLQTSLVRVAEGPLPPDPSEDLGLLMHRCARVGGQSFDDVEEARDVAGWWARIHGLNEARISRDGRRYVVGCW